MGPVLGIIAIIWIIIFAAAVGSVTQQDGRNDTNKIQRGRKIQPEQGARKGDQSDNASYRRILEIMESASAGMKPFGSGEDLSCPISSSGRSEIDKDSGALRVHYKNEIYSISLDGFIRQLTKEPGYLYFNNHTIDTLQTLFRFYGADKVSNIIRQCIPYPPVGELLYEQPGSPLIRCFLGQNGINLWRVYYLNGQYIGAKTRKPEDEINQIENANLFPEEKLSIARKLRKLCPCSTLRLSEICKDPHHYPGNMEALSMDPEQTEQLSVIADHFFAGLSKPLIESSGDAHADRLEAMLRLYRFILSLNIRPRNPLSASVHNTMANELYYVYATGTEHCYDGGNCMDCDVNYSITLKLYPSDTWEERQLLCDSNSHFLFPCSEQSLTQGDCECFFDRRGSLILRDPFGLRAVLEIQMQMQES